MSIVPINPYSLAYNSKEKYDTNYINRVYINIINKSLLKIDIFFPEINFTPNICYDIGSCALQWTNAFIKFCPNTKCILFDAFEPCKFLYKNYDYHIGVLTEYDNCKMKFYQDDINFILNSYYDNELFPRHYYMDKTGESLDTIVEYRNFPLPDIIKINTCGSELDILKGSVKALKNCKLLYINIEREIEETKQYLSNNGFTDIICKRNNQYCFKRN